MNSRTIRLFSCLIVFQLTCAGFARALTSEGQKSETLVTFDSDEVLSKITTNEGVRISRSSDGALEVHVTPFEQHKNNWPVVAFDGRLFGRKLNLANYSRVEVALQHQTDGLSRIDFQLSTGPDASSGVDYEDYLVPGHSPWTARIDLTTLKNNDPSEVSVLQFIFRPRPTETAYRIESVRAIYDPAIGSPAEKLESKVTAARQQFAKVKDLPSKLPAEQQDKARTQIAALAEQFDKLSAQLVKAKAQNYAGTLRALMTQADEVVNELGRMRFLADGPLLVWTPDPYRNILRATGPDPKTELLKNVSLAMAGNEFRDIVFSTTASGRDLSLNIAVESTGSTKIPAKAVEVRVTEYPKNLRGEYTGDALINVDGPVQIPAGETRQFWVRFNSRTVDLPAGDYAFNIAVNDDAAGARQVIPGKLTVWNFRLPNYDILPNNSYAIFSQGMRGDTSGEVFHQAVADMKAYGLNYIFVEPPEIPVPTGLDDNWQITGYSDEAFSSRLKSSVKAWQQAPGDDQLCFIIALSNFEDLGLKKDGYAFPNDKWKGVLRQYINHLKSLIADAGVKQNQWMLVLRDESMEPVLTKYDIPMAEAIKEIDPSIRIKCNSSAVISDPKWVERYFKAFDVFQPHRGRIDVLKFLRKSGRPIWFYECDTALTTLGRDLYDYYRVYTWDMLEQGIVGTGVWTYYSSPHDRPWNEDFQGCQLIYLHPQHGLVHSRRYEMFRETADDFRYVSALRSAAKAKGGQAIQDAESLIQQAVKEITTNRQDPSRCEHWRMEIANRIVGLTK